MTRLLSLSTGGADEVGADSRYTERGADGTGGWLQHRDPIGVVASGPGNDWVTPLAEPLAAARDFEPPGCLKTHRPRILVLYGSLRESSFSRKLALETARLSELLGCDVRVYNPDGLPVRDPTLDQHPKVLELRELSKGN